MLSQPGMLGKRRRGCWCCCWLFIEIFLKHEHSFQCQAWGKQREEGRTTERVSQLNSIQVAISFHITYFETTTRYLLLSTPQAISNNFFNLDSKMWLISIKCVAMATRKTRLPEIYIYTHTHTHSNMSFLRSFLFLFFLSTSACCKSTGIAHLWKYRLIPLEI